MKKILAILYIFTVITHPAFAQDADSECASYPDIPVNIQPRFDDPVYDLSAGIATIQNLANDTAHTIHENHKNLTLGLTHYESVLEFHVPIKGIKFPNGLTCAHVEHVDVVIGYKDVTVYIPHEVPQGSCGFTEVMAHEQKHIDVNRQILQEYAPHIAERLQAYLKLNGVFREENSDYAVSLLNQKLQAILDELATQMIGENRRRQQLIDSPAEYRRISTACNGQLTQTATQFLRSGR